MEIMKGAESNSFDGNSDIGVLVLQGFTGTVNSVIYLAEYLAKKGYHMNARDYQGTVQSGKTSTRSSLLIG